MMEGYKNQLGRSMMPAIDVSNGRLESSFIRFG